MILEISVNITHFNKGNIKNLKFKLFLILKNMIDDNRLKRNTNILGKSKKMMDSQLSGNYIYLELI